MNDSLRTDVFVRYRPEIIATACIYLSARKLKIPMPRSPSWFEVLGVEEDDIRDCCYRIVCLYNTKKAKFDELDANVESLKKKMDDERRANRENRDASKGGTPSQSSPASKQASPSNNHVSLCYFALFIITLHKCDFGIHRFDNSDLFHTG